MSMHLIVRESVSLQQNPKYRQMNIIFKNFLNNQLTYYIHAYRNEIYHHHRLLPLLLIKTKRFCFLYDKKKIENEEFKKKKIEKKKGKIKNA